MNKLRIDCLEDPDGSISLHVPPEVAQHFKQMVTRAMMTWQDPHPEIRNFADRLSGLAKLLPKAATELAGRQELPGEIQ